VHPQHIKDIFAGRGRFGGVGFRPFVKGDD